MFDKLSVCRPMSVSAGTFENKQGANENFFLGPQDLVNNLTNACRLGLQQRRRIHHINLRRDVPGGEWYIEARPLAHSHNHFTYN